MSYRVGDEVADDLLDPVDVHVEDQAPLRSESFVRNGVETGLLIYPYLRTVYNF